MNANELADELNKCIKDGSTDLVCVDQAAAMLRQQQEQIDKLTAIVALRELKIERMIEDRSKYEALAHAGGVEAGKELAVMEVMSENCTCYKLGYSQLNDYAKVKAK
jgi:hypothetical protein